MNLILKSLNILSVLLTKVMYAGSYFMLHFSKSSGIISPACSPASNASNITPELSCLFSYFHPRLTPSDPERTPTLTQTLTLTLGTWATHARLPRLTFGACASARSPIPAATYTACVQAFDGGWMVPTHGPQWLQIRRRTWPSALRTPVLAPRSSPLPHRITVPPPPPALSHWSLPLHAVVLFPPHPFMSMVPPRF